MNILTVKHLDKHFDKVRALSDVSLDIKEGAIMGLLGPNGAGKTTLLRIINGILSKDHGEVKILGEDVNLKTAQNIGYMPEERGLYDNMTVGNQIVFFGQLKGGNPIRLREVMREYLRLFNIENFESRKVKELSKGNQQKVQIIATLVHEPKLVILDEPFSGFDPINGALLQQIIERLHTQGTTVILSSHNMHAVEEMCDSIALINNGKVLLTGDISDIKEANKNNEILITTTEPIDTENINTSLVSGITQATSRGMRKGYSYKVLKNENVTNKDILSYILDKSEIVHFEEALPSLNDIFIKYTT